jgi:hypothetical protein
VLTSLDSANKINKQRAIADSPWKEYTAEGGRKYWHNVETKVTTWELPKDLKDALAKAETQVQHHQPPARPAAPYVPCLTIPNSATFTNFS